MPTVYICLKYWEGPDLGIGASASCYFQACGLQNYEAGSMAWEEDVSVLSPSPENAGKSRAKPRNLEITEGKGQETSKKPSKISVPWFLPTDVNHISLKPMHLLHLVLLASSDKLHDIPKQAGPKRHMPNVAEMELMLTQARGSACIAPLQQRVLFRKREENMFLPQIACLRLPYYRREKDCAFCSQATLHGL